MIFCQWILLPLSLSEVPQVGVAAGWAWISWWESYFSCDLMPLVMIDGYAHGAYHVVGSALGGSFHAWFEVYVWWDSPVWEHLSCSRLGRHHFVVSFEWASARYGMHCMIPLHLLVTHFSLLMMCHGLVVWVGWCLSALVFLYTLQLSIG